MKKITLLAASVASIAMFSGCAGMISGKTQNVTFKSEPAEADVYVNGVIMGKTPMTASIKKGKEQMATIKKDGYKSVDIPLTTSFDFAALIGLISYATPLTTDISQGTAYEFSPGYYNIDLKKADVK
ncbi:MAG: PEGA domain-containing protein [Sulfuricurvum sp.]|nr:PEGA domain-containing protein [Sulfuricurvum sp.]